MPALAALRGGGPKAIKPNFTGIGVWRSLVAHLVRDEGVAGSNPATPTTIFDGILVLG